MGQYYRIINVDKKEWFSPSDFKGGIKLMEWSYVGNETVSALCHLLYTRWRGDRVYVVGDYASSTDGQDFSENYTYTLEYIERELDLGDEDSLYRWVESEGWKHIHAEKTDAEYAIIENLATGDYVKIQKKDLWQDEDGFTVSPVPLLLCMGNGQGGGDYRGNNEKYVGEFVKTSPCVRILRSDDPITGINEFVPSFIE